MIDAFERKMIYAFLSAIFRHPDDELLATLGGIQKETFESVFPGLDSPPAVTLEELRDGYTHLFTARPDGSPVAPPYGSVYLEGPENAGASTRLVSTLYESTGLDPKASPEPSDYLPIELEFLYYLTEGEERSRNGETASSPQRWVSSQADFFHNFFYPWIDPFCTRIEEEDQAHPFYRWAAGFLRRFTQRERERLKS